MTQIEKEAFLGNYIGCEIEWLRESDNKWITTTLTASDFSFLVKKKCRLIVKSIESITDEDAIGLAKLTGNYFQGVDHSKTNNDQVREYWTQNMIAYGMDFISNYSLNRGTYSMNTLLKAFDFLRSKGYLPPFRQYSTEQLIESGIVKI